VVFVFVVFFQMEDYHQAIQAYAEEVCGRVLGVAEKAGAAVREALSDHLPLEVVGCVMAFLPGQDIPSLRQHLAGFAPVLYRLVRHGAHSLNHSVLSDGHHEFWQHSVVSNAECNRHYDFIHEVFLTGCNCRRCGGYKNLFRAWETNLPHAVRCRCGQ
jgi:hypothetical protein